MKSSTRLDSIVFQLTPTRTRCDLVITANGKFEKIASGLLDPFLAHLKAAQEQIGKGGYSIVLVPHHGVDATWFTKGTVERFVRFVSTPEILERVCTIESEILQIEKSISLQNSHDSSPHIGEDIPLKSEESLEGIKLVPGGNEEKAIVLYQPDSHQSEEKVSNVSERNSKVQLVQVLETRKTVLQKEQGMAFARAVAASFNIDNIAALLTFADCFGASRMMDACKKFMHLWKAKHESGQWVEVEATDALPSTNAAGIVFHSPNENKEFKDSMGQGDAASEKIGTTPDNQAQPVPQGYNPGQFPHPMFAPWQMHPQASGMPAFSLYPMQGIPYYQNYPGNNPYFQPPYPPYDDPRLNTDQKTRRRRHSMDSRDMSVESDGQETDTSGRKVQDDVSMDDEDGVSRRRRSKGGSSARKQSKTVVIRNINYIASAKHDSGESDPQSCSDSDTGTRNSRKKGVFQISDDSKERMSGQPGDDGHWQAFQSFLLTDADESSNSVRGNMYAMEGKVQGRNYKSAIGDASFAFGRRDMDGTGDVNFSERLDISGDTTSTRKRIGDQMLSYGQEATLRHGDMDGRVDLQFSETGSRTRAHRRPADTDMDYVMNRQEKLTDLWDSSLDPVISNGIQGSTIKSSREPHAMADESIVVLQRTGSLDQVAGDGRTAMDMDYQLSSALQKTENLPTDTSGYEPNDLNLMPNRVVEREQNGYDPAMDFEMQAQVKEAAKQSGGRNEVTKGLKEGPRKSVKDQKLKADRRTAAGTRREKPSKLSPSEDARARAEKLRAFKAELQKQKKEKEEEQFKRLEALKLQRQKRIAARSGASLPQSTMSSQQSRKQLPKLSPVSQKGSKFSDAEPGSSSPLQRSTLKNVSRLLTAKVSKSGTASSQSQVNGGNRLTRSASSLSMRQEETNNLTPGSKATTDRIRRLSEPKSVTYYTASVKTRSAEAVSKRRSAERSEMKKMSVATKSDKSKTIAPPEQNLRASKGYISIQKKPRTKEMPQSLGDKNLSTDSVTSNLTRSMSPPPRDEDDNTVVEKTVVMLEFNKPEISVSRVPENKSSVHNVQSDKDKDPCGRQEEHLAVPSPASPIILKEVDSSTCSREVKVQSYASLNEADEASPNLPDVNTIEKPYQAPYARVSSIEDPCTVESQYGKAPLASFGSTLVGVQTDRVLVPDGSKQDVVEISETTSKKHIGKEASKGFKRLLKFGKKNSTASESNIDLDKASFDGSMASDYAVNGSSGEALTLKNLLIQEESSSAGTTPKKSSRPFSLFSPFKSKSADKKSTA